MTNKRLVVVIVICALLFVAVAIPVFASDRSWELDCYGRQVVVESVGIAHFKVKCVGIAAPPINTIERKERPPAKGYPAPEDDWPYAPPPTWAPGPTLTMPPLPTLAPTMDPWRNP